ncbi:putative ferric-chelate reductase 1 [Orchesella cincta]|uniref:Putative ferric-chelate reductase 1 n=1 Tax=Orchesella cincta TaxID=48709 RepID=A0A1D2NHY2_ORCCI|nr:putative ferric-chelate reductase 1 [Orchesella cincta]
MDGNVRVGVSIMLIFVVLLTIHGANSASEKIKMCYKPKFFTANNCGAPTAINSALKASESISVDISRMPLDTDLWLHIDVMPSRSAITSKNTIKIKFAMVQITDTDNRFLGHIAEQVPCNTLKPSGGHQYTSGNLSELYHNPGPKNIHIFQCPISEDLSYNVKPTIPVLEFKNPVEAFYVNLKFTQPEINHIRDDSKKNEIFITTVLVDQTGACHFHRLSKLEALPAKPLERDIIVEVPIACHSVGPAFKDGTGVKGPFMMNPSQKETFSDLEFIDPSWVSIRPPSNMAKILMFSWKQAVINHNRKVYKIEADGDKSNLTRNGTTAVRRPDVDLIVVNVQASGENLEIPMEPEDEMCDGLRNKTAENVPDLISHLYRKCGYLIGCIGEPDDCIHDRNCRVIVGWTKAWDHVFFEVIISQRVYVAVGISKDEEMGDDSVTECVREHDKVVGYTSWNYNIDGVKGNKRRTSCDSMQDFKGGIQKENDHIMYCSWKRPVVTIVKGTTFDLDKPHYVLIAEGDFSASGVLGGLGKHDMSHVFSEALILNDYFGKSPVEYWFAKIHGFLMLFTWLFFVPVATFTVRYLKGTFTDRRLCREKYTFWFGIHGALVLATIFLTLTSVILLMAVDWHWAYEPERLLSPHSILGLLIFFILLVQMGLAYNIVKRPEKYYLGEGNCVFKIVACVYTSKYERDGLDCDAAYVIIGYLVCYFLIHAFMSYQVCFTDFLIGRESSRVYKVFLIDKPEDTGSDEPGAPARKIVFYVLIALLAIFNLYFLIMAFHPAALDCASKDAMQPPTLLKIGLLQ